MIDHLALIITTILTLILAFTVLFIGVMFYYQQLKKDFKSIEANQFKRG